MKNSTQGFTLIELLIVIAIIGILAAVLIPNLLGAQKRAYDTGAQACAKSIQTALATYYIDTKSYAGITTANVKDQEGVSANCKEGTMTVTVVGTPTVADYTVTIADSRGKKTFTAKPESLTGS
ncbi:type IV pilin protein [Deinococcus sp. 23YEL01]|uniref:type IV pilin protein n=1 Tax=Deinococcus sp. 23YEL01 TaxID=2745871 RepID=UPI001E490C23|nr:type II secretion system protein [Deinococcus sp. 23YEL01]MCD0169397.1 type II secretion system protein [Deinococcus sp. 23YEL01]